MLKRPNEDCIAIVRMEFPYKDFNHARGILMRHLCSDAFCEELAKANAYVVNTSRQSCDNIVTSKLALESF